MRTRPQISLSNRDKAAQSSEGKLPPRKQPAPSKSGLQEQSMHSKWLLISHHFIRKPKNFPHSIMQVLCIMKLYQHVFHNFKGQKYVMQSKCNPGHQKLEICSLQAKITVVGISISMSNCSQGSACYLLAVAQSAPGLQVEGDCYIVNHSVLGGLPEATFCPPLPQSL